MCQHVNFALLSNKYKHWFSSQGIKFQNRCLYEIYIRSWIDFLIFPNISLKINKNALAISFLKQGDPGLMWGLTNYAFQNCSITSTVEIFFLPKPQQGLKIVTVMLGTINIFVNISTIFKPWELASCFRSVSTNDKCICIGKY